MTKHTDYINLTNDELLNLTYMKDNATPLEVELAQRLEAVLEEVGDTLTSTVSLGSLTG